MTAVRTPFEILGVAQDATAADVRRAYRRLALRHHPDRNQGDPAAAEAFLEVQTAHAALQRADPDAGFGAEHVAAQVQRAAEEVERRRSRPGEGARAWQQGRFALDRPRSERYAAVLRTPETLVGLALSVGVAVALAAGLGPLAGVLDPWLGSAGWVTPAGAAGLGGLVGTLAAARLLVLAEPPPHAVEMHWQGLRDLRWNVLLDWDEIRGVRQRDGVVDLAVTEQAAGRLRPLVPAETWHEPHVYQIPMRDGARLLAVLDKQLKSARG